MRNRSNLVQFDGLSLSEQPALIRQSKPSKNLLRNHTWLIVALVATILWFPVNALAARTLNQAIAGALDLNCEGIGGDGGDAGFVDELNDLCINTNGSGVGGAGGSEAGSAQSLGVTVENRRTDRLEGKPSGNQAILNLPNGLGLYITGNFEALDREKTTFSDGFDSTVLGTTVGADFRFSNKFLAGAAFNYVNRDGDFKGNGDFSTNSYGLLVYASFVPVPAAFLDLSIGYTGHNYEVKRSTTYTNLGGDTFGGNTKSDSDGDQISINAVSGYDFNIGTQIGSITVGPRIGFNYSQLTIDPYSESGGSVLALAYDEQSTRSLQSTIGLQGSMAINTSYGVWVPQATVDYHHEFENDQRDITVRFVQDQRSTQTKFTFNNDKPDRNFFNFSVGTVVVLPHGIQPFFNFRVMAGNSQFDNYAGTVGVRIEGS